MTKTKSPVAEDPVSIRNFLILLFVFSFRAKINRTKPSRQNIPIGIKNNLEPLNKSLIAGTQS